MRKGQGRYLISPEKDKLLHKVSYKREIMQQCGHDAFLVPDLMHPKYPIMDTDCKVNCGMVRAALMRARMNMNRQGINPEAKKMAAEAAKKAEARIKKECEGK